MERKRAGMGIDRDWKKYCGETGIYSTDEVLSSEAHRALLNQGIFATGAFVS